MLKVLIDFSLTVKAATLIFIPGPGSAISSAKQGKSDSIYNLVKNLNSVVWATHFMKILTINTYNIMNLVVCCSRVSI